MMHYSCVRDNRGPGSAKHHAAKSGVLHRARDTSNPTLDSTAAVRATFSRRHGRYRGDGAMDEVLINKTTTGDQEQPGIAGFGGPQFAVVWSDRATGNIKGQLLGVKLRAATSSP
jgi:hypothetical protein